MNERVELKHRTSQRCEMPIWKKKYTDCVETHVLTFSQQHPEVISLLFPAIYDHAAYENQSWVAHHSYRVAVLSAFNGSEFDFSGGILTDVIVSGLLHDIGKTAIPTSVLNDPYVTQEELNMVIRAPHVRRGYEICEAYGLYDIAEIILRHHEYNDPEGIPSYPRKSQNGTGVPYNGPDRRKRKEISIAKKMATLAIQVADKIDGTLSAYFDGTKRPYQKYPKRSKHDSITHIQLLFSPKTNPDLFVGFSERFTRSIPAIIQNTATLWEKINTQPIPESFISPLLQHTHVEPSIQQP